MAIHTIDRLQLERRELVDGASKEVVLPDLERARRDLDGSRSQRLHLEAALRLPMYFTVGRTFPDVARLVLYTVPREVEWRTDGMLELV